MKRFFLAFCLLLFSSYLSAVDSNSSSTYRPSEQTIVVSYVDMPLKLYQNQIFAIKLKAIIGTNGAPNITYTASNDEGLKPLNQGAQFAPDKDGTYSLVLTYKVISNTNVKTPDFVVNFTGGNEKDANSLEGRSYNILPLLNSSNFANISAQNLQITNYKMDKYDNDNNILAFEVQGKLANLDNFKLKNVTSQGTNKLKFTNTEATLFYYIVIPSTQDSLEFQYLNTEKDQLQSVFLKLDMSKFDDKVSTQTDLSPKSKDKALYVFIVVSLIATILYAIYYFKREKIFLILIFAVIGSGFLFLFIPNEEAKIKKDCVIYLLPTESSTPFYKAPDDEPIEKIKEADGFIKVKLKDGKIGWTRSECVIKN